MEGTVGTDLLHLAHENDIDLEGDIIDLLIYSLIDNILFLLFLPFNYIILLRCLRRLFSLFYLSRDFGTKFL